MQMQPYLHTHTQSTLFTHTYIHMYLSVNMQPQHGANLLINHLFIQMQVQSKLNTYYFSGPVCVDFSHLLVLRDLLYCFNVQNGTNAEYFQRQLASQLGRQYFIIQIKYPFFYITYGTRIGQVKNKSPMEKEEEWRKKKLMFRCTMYNRCHVISILKLHSL